MLFCVEMIFVWKMVFPSNLAHSDVNNIYNAKLGRLPLVMPIMDSARKGYIVSC